MNPFDAAPIARITVITEVGVKSYAVGQQINGKKIEKIVLQKMPVSDKKNQYYYCGFDTNHVQPLVFSVSVNCPHEIEYA